MLKAKISQTKSNLYVVKTTKYDTTDLELIVETTDSSPWLNPKFELLGIKSDGHEVRQTENFKVIDLNNHIVQVTLDEQFVTCDGNADLQLIIKDGSRKSSTPFKLHVGRSLDSDILESHRNVKVLDELEKYIIEGREYISEATELAQSIANRVQAVNTQVEANEAQRLQNESQRQSAETKRKEAEDDRNQAEVLRVQNEDTRQSAEVIRTANEQTRVENESNRIERETARENKESIRQTQEQQRHTSESTRQSQEATRQSNEDNRKQAEKSRSQEETVRINNEATREQAEDNRQSQELDRQSDESARQAAETNRMNAESTRAQNENTRKSQETTRQQKETERQSAETARQQNETSRQTAETKRAEAENARKAAETTRSNDMQAFKDEANRLATELNTQSSRLDQLTEDTENQINEFVETNQTAVDSFLETADSRLVNDKDKIDYLGNGHNTLRETMDSNVDFVLGEVNRVHYEGQNITALDSIAGQAKNAIVEGQTLVNLCPDSIYTNQGWSGGLYKVFNNFPLLIKGKKYTIYAPIGDKTGNPNDALVNLYVKNGESETRIYKTFGDGHDTIHKTFTMGNVLEFNNYSITGERFKQNYPNVVIIEGEWTLEEMPNYFEGMASVKAPVLKSVGKNLFDKNTANLNCALNGDGTLRNLLDGENNNVSDYIPVKGNIQYAKTTSDLYCEYDINKNFIRRAGGAMFTTSDDCKFIRINIVDIDNHQLEESSSATPFEPYKSNTLSTPEDLELRGFGNVKDSLDITLGEKVERISEIVLDGSENWVVDSSLFNNTYRFTLMISNMICKSWHGTITQGPFVKSSVFRSLDLRAEEHNLDTEHLTGWDNSRVVLNINKTKLSENSVRALKTYLQANPIIVQYQLATPIVKTVELSNNVVYSYENITHYDCSSAEGSLIPTLSIDVPTNLSALVSRQRETIKVQEDQIKLLEETNSELVISQETQDEEIITNMLASVELFEMVLSMMPTSASISKSMEVNPMVEVYVTLILKGEKTIEQVPAVIRDKVQAQLDLLTK